MTLAMTSPRRCQGGGTSRQRRCSGAEVAVQCALQLFKSTASNLAPPFGGAFILLGLRQFPL